ncbi:MAG: hypothetical protein HYV52_01230 [Parcubacteria group bacterium]|nr:hypothetical protein [Parcubacteria group bacterium]
MRKELQKICGERGFSAEEIKQLFSFLARLAPSERQTFFLILKGFPEYLPVFKEILAAKLDFIKQSSHVKLADILNEEEKILTKTIADLNQK